MKYVLICVLIVFSVGCSTISSKAGEDAQWGSPYSGVKDSPSNGRYYVSKAEKHLPLYLVTFCSAVVDFVASFAADTILLPIDIGVYFSDENNETDSDQEAEEQMRQEDI